MIKNIIKFGFFLIKKIMNEIIRINLLINKILGFNSKFCEVPRFKLTLKLDVVILNSL